MTTAEYLKAEAKRREQDSALASLVAISLIVAETAARKIGAAA